MKFAFAAVALGGAVVIGLVSWFGVRSIGHEVLEAGWVIPITTALLFLQLYLSAAAWRITVGEPRPRLGRYFRIRWVREAVNSLLPVAQLGGNLVGIRMLVQRGVAGPVAAAGTTLDLTIEAVTQFLFTLAGFAVLIGAGTGAGPGAGTSRPGAAPWVIWSMSVMGCGLLGFILAQRAGLLRLIEWLAARLTRLFPGLSVESVRGLHRELMRLHQDRTALAKATGLHLLAWVLGVIETWLALFAMGHLPSLSEAFVIESLGMAARSAGFAVPGALGVQEAGFIVVCELFGLGPDIAIALSMVKRARELLVGIPGLIVWQFAEGKRILTRS